MAQIDQYVDFGYYDYGYAVGDSESSFGDCGPWTIDTIDGFGSLDSLTLSLDDAIWNSANTCIFTADSSINGNAQVSGIGTRIFTGASSISGFATLSCLGIRIGDNWGNVSVGSNTWENVSAGSNDWADKQTTDNTWLRQG